MTLKLKERYCDGRGLQKILDEIADNIMATQPSVSNLAIIGILTGGTYIADFIAERIGNPIKHKLPVSYLNITLYRDDMINTQREPFSRYNEIPFSVTNKDIILVDDVLFTGRTVQAALTSILTLGRPDRIRLATVVDRGFRELPIQADFVGCHIETTRSQGIRVKTPATAEEPGIYILEDGH